MTTTRVVLRLIVPMLCLVLVAARPVLAQPRASFPIVYVSLQRVLNESDSAKAAAGELEALRATKTQEVAVMQQALEQTRLQLANAGGYFSSSRRSKLQETVRQQEAQLQQATQLAQGTIAELQRMLQARLRDDLNVVVTELARQRGVLYVLNQDAAVILAPAGANVTDEVLVRLNAVTAQRDAAGKTPAPKAP